MSKYQFKLPDIGEGIAEGVIGEWHVKVGDTIKEDDDLVQIENDKSVEEIPSPVAGKVTAIVVPEGETAEVGDVLVELEVAEGLGNVDDSATKTPAKAEEKTQPAPEPVAEQTSKAPVEVSVQDHSLPVLAMPSVRKFARENGVELAKIKGTGRHGQVTKADIEQALSLPQDAPVAAPETKTEEPVVALPAR